MPHDPASWRVRPTDQGVPPSVGLLAKCPQPPLALAIEAEWRKRAAGVVPAQPRERPEGKRHRTAPLVANHVVCFPPFTTKTCDKETLILRGDRSVAGIRIPAKSYYLSVRF